MLGNGRVKIGLHVLNNNNSNRNSGNNKNNTAITTSTHYLSIYLPIYLFPPIHLSLPASSLPGLLSTHRPQSSSPSLLSPCLSLSSSQSASHHIFLPSLLSRSLSLPHFYLSPVHPFSLPPFLPPYYTFYLPLSLTSSSLSPNQLSTLPSCIPSSPSCPLRHVPVVKVAGGGRGREDAGTPPPAFYRRGRQAGMQTGGLARCFGGPLLPTLVPASHQTSPFELQGLKCQFEETRNVLFVLLLI